MIMIYLASPYTHKNQEVVEQRVRDVCRVAAHLMRGGAKVFSPIAHCHAIAKHGKLPTEFSWWEDYDKFMIAMCDSILVVTSPGWERSVGIVSEVEYAESLNIPVASISPLTYEIFPFVCPS